MNISFTMAALEAAIHSAALEAWMAGSSPAMVDWF
jgi:hypothetical protein